MSTIYCGLSLFLVTSDLAKMWNLARAKYAMHILS
jgi:hypothetical protein